jgi:hypothetical protein
MIKHLKDIHRIDIITDFIFQNQPNTSTTPQTLDGFEIDIIYPKEIINNASLAEAWIEGGPISKNTARGWRFQRHFSQCLPKTFNDKVISEIISTQSQIRDKQISHNLKQTRVSLLMDGWQRHEKDIFNIIVGGNYILSIDLKVKETIENVQRDTRERLSMKSIIEEMKIKWCQIIEDKKRKRETDERKNKK